MGIENIYKGSTITYGYLKEEKIESTPQQKVISLNQELQNAVAKIGKLQYYYTEIEYPLELPYERKNLDVIWKR